MKFKSNLALMFICNAMADEDNPFKKDGLNIYKAQCKTYVDYEGCVRGTRCAHKVYANPDREAVVDARNKDKGTYHD